MKLSNLYCSLQLKGAKKFFKEIQNSIEPSDIHEMGIEEEPHITVMYSEQTNEHINPVETFKKILSINKRNLRGKSVELNTLTLFVGEDFDVLKFEVVCPLLNLLHNSIKHISGLQPTFPIYKPHATVAYLKKGVGEKYLKFYGTKNVKINKLKMRINIIDSDGTQKKPTLTVKL